MTQKLRSQAVSYDLTELLGEGLNGTVYKAVRSDPFDHVRQTVALKILKSRNLVEIWKREFESLAKVHSPHCVRVFGFEWMEDRPALVLEYVPGVSLRQFCLSGGITPEFAREILAQIQAGLDELHSLGLVHGDLSPNNIMIATDGTVKLLDFGCGGEGAIQATPEFAAPEILSGARPTRLSDFYSLGALENLLTRLQTSRLSEYPLQRNAFTGTSRAPTKQQLGEHIQHFVEQQNHFRNLATKSMHIVRKAIFPLSAFSRRFRGVAFRVALILGLVIAAPKAQVIGLTTPTSSVRVRTHRWMKISVDGEEIGFTPQELLLREGSHTLEWSSAKASGEIHFTLKPGEKHSFQDRDFPHGDIAF
jgi:serine/threonine protein kinase